MKKLTLIMLFSLFIIPSFSLGAVNYNDPNVSKEVNRLRKFRDLHLKKYEAGRAFIKYYYKYGPISARAIEERDRLRSLVRLCLLPLMYAGKHFDGVLMSLKILLGLFTAFIFWSVFVKLTARGHKNKRVTIVY